MIQELDPALREQGERLEVRFRLRELRLDVGYPLGSERLPDPARRVAIARDRVASVLLASPGDLLDDAHELRGLPTTPRPTPKPTDASPIGS